MQVPKNFWFCISFKNGAAIMAASNLAFAISTVIGCSIELRTVKEPEDELYFILTLVMGISNLCIGGVIITALISGNEKHVLLYILLEFSNLLIITIFAGINCVGYQSLYLVILLIVCLIFWYGLWCMYGFYTELAEYNAVKSGVIEIVCNTNINPLSFPEKAVESTAV